MRASCPGAKSEFPPEGPLTLVKYRGRRHSFPGQHLAWSVLRWALHLEGSRAWLQALRKTPGAYGIMYTTWEGRYGLLPDFGDLVSAR